MAETTWTSEAEGLALLLKEREPGYRALASSLPGGAVFVVDRGLRYLLAEGEALRDAGFTSADFEGKTVLEATADPLAAEYEANIRRVLAGEEFRHEHQAHGRYFSSRGTPLRDDAGEICAALVVSYDVTGQKRTEEALRRSEQRYRALSLASSDVAYGMSADWSVMLPLDGRGLVESNEEPIRGWLEKNIPASEHAAIREGISQAIATKSLFEMEHRVTRPDGSIGWTRSRAVPILDDHGNIVEWFGAASDITERKRSEAALRESEVRYRDLFESMDEGYCIIEVLFDSADPSRAIDYRFVEVNPAFEAQSGMLNVVGRRMLEFVPSIEPHWLENYGRVALTGEPIRFAGEYTGLHRWFEVFAFRVGEPAAHQVAVLFTDITPRTRAEAALRESEERFRAMADNAPMMVWVTEADGTCTYLSQSWYEFTDQTPETGLGFGWVRALHPEDKEEAEREFLEANREQRPFQVEYRLRRADGEYRWAIDSAKPRFSPNGEFLGYIGSVIDITERKESEEVLRRSEERFRVMTDAVPQIVWIVGADGRAEYFNRQWYEYTGCSSAPLDTREAAEGYVHPEDVQLTLERFEESARTKVGFAVEHRIRSAAGEYRWFLVRAEPYQDPETGDIVRWYGSSTDIHDSKLKDEALQRANEVLEARVDERTRELLEKNLELEGFTYSVSHDMRAPLRAIVSNAQITLEDEGPNVSPEGRERLERLSKASMRMAELIDDLLQYARLGTRQLRIEKIDLVELARQTARDVSADRGDCELLLTADGPLWVECDPRLIGMALHNLLDNACKYRTAGETAQVELRSEDRNGETVYFVKDRGIGFDMAYVGKLFQAFERLHREEYTGTGIGLANVKRAVQRHGGRVWAESEGPGKGATFFFTLG